MNTNILLGVEEPSSLLPLLGWSTLPFGGIRHLGFKFLKLKNFVETFIQKIYAIINQKVQEVKIDTLLLLFSYLLHKKIKIKLEVSLEQKQNQTEKKTTDTNSFTFLQTLR